MTGEAPWQIAKRVQARLRQESALKRDARDMRGWQEAEEPKLRLVQAAPTALLPWGKEGEMVPVERRRRRRGKRVFPSLLPSAAYVSIGVRPDPVAAPPSKRGTWRRKRRMERRTDAERGRA